MTILLRELPKNMSFLYFTYVKKNSKKQNIINPIPKYFAQLDNLFFPLYMYYKINIRDSTNIVLPQQ